MKKWTKLDVFVLLLEILAPIASLIITIIWGGGLTEDIRLGIITAGIAIPIALLQVSNTQAQNKSENEIQGLKKDIQDLQSNLSEYDDKISHISPIMEHIFLANNEMIKRFAYRRMNEAIKSVMFAISNNRSGILRPNEYYEELFYLAEIIKQDYQINKKNYGGEIWAMTSFAEEEWSADQGYEQRWTEELNELVSIGIFTRRLCIISDEIFNIINDESFNLEDSLRQSASFKAFWEFLKLYYEKGPKRNVSQFAIRKRDCSFLSDIKGFFAIKLSNHELHILYGETVDSNGALTSELLFDKEQIKTVRKFFERHSTPTHSISAFINRHGSASFKKCLKNNNILLQLNAEAN